MANNSNDSKKYISLNRLSNFLDNIKAKYSQIGHKHTMSDLTDYKVDTTLSSTSNNPIANKTVDAEFDAIATAMGALDLAIDGKADKNHNHDSAYDTKGAANSALASAKSYTDTKFSNIPSVDAYTKSEIDVAFDEIDEVIDSKADASHTHSISNVTNLQSSLDAKVPTSRTVNGKSLSANISLTASDVGAAPSSHNHSDLYYTETEVDTKLASKADKIHNHDADYDAKGSASAVQENLNAVSDTIDAHIDNADIHVTTTNKSNWNTAYTHSQATHARTDATKVADSSTNGNILINGTETNVYTHPNSGVTAGTYKSVTVNAQGHITGGSNPTTLSGYGITDAESKGAASAALASAKEYTDTVASGKSDSGHNHDSAYDTKGAASSALASAKEYADSAATTAASKVKNDLLNGAGTAYDTLKELGDLIVDNQDAIDALETVAAGKADKTHGHAIADVSGLQTALDGKAASSHGTHVSFSSTAPVMDGTASVGSASTVARSDHKHPTDTSRASKTEFDTHTGNTTVHITSTERTNWNAAKTHADSAHAPSNAQANQNAFSNIKVGSTTIAADTTTDTLELVGSNVTITPDATNDKVTIAVADGSTSSKGLVQLTNSTSSTSTTTAATPSSVKSAYDLANTAKTNAATAQARADSAYTLADGKVDSLSDLGITATATELNYVDGVTSSIQTQLNGKATSGHTHSNVSLGQGYATCSTAASTTAKKASLSNYELTTGGVVSVRFTYSVPASATLNINSKGAKSIYYKNTAIVANVIKGGDIATFIFDGTRYHLISVDRWHEDIVELQANESKVKQMETVANGNFSLLLAPSDIEGTEYRYAYYADGIYANPSLKRIYADINGTATGVRGVTSGNFLVGNGTGANTMVEKTPAEVLEMIGGIGADNISEQVDTLINNIDNLVYVNEESQESAVVPLNADTLGGKTEAMLSVANANTLGGYSVDSLISKIYPVGSIYMSVNSTSPSTLFGGTWVQLKDRFLLGAGTTYSAGATGGEAEHTLTVDEMPSHTHGATGVNDGAGTSGNAGNYPIRIYQDIASNWPVSGIQYTGGSQAHNNMPPYLAVYMWKRTA